MDGNKFGFSTTAAEVVEGVDLAGKRAIVTGGAAGIGVETARALASAGASVTLAVRRPEAAEAVATALRHDTGDASIEVRRLDVADPSSVAAFADVWTGPLDILINNAGIMALPQVERTAAGVEMQLATNFLGHFDLMCRLHPALAKARGARVVAVSSNANLMAPVFFDDANFHFIAYEPFLAYGQSKTACILMAVEAARRWASEGICVNALNPGAIATNLQIHTGGLRTPKERQKTPEQGAATSVLLAASPTVAGVSGKYYEDCQEAPVVQERPADFRGVAHYAVGPDNASRLWKLGLRLAGIA